jgi:threonine-phosphate decarboxylase
MESLMMRFPIHGGQPKAIANNYGISEALLLDFSANINPEGPPPSVLEALRTGLDTPSVLARYPDLQSHNLKHAIAGYHGIKEANVSIGNGFVPLLEAALRSLPIRSCIVPMPSFNEYTSALTRAGVQIVPLPLTAESGFEYEAEYLFRNGEHCAVLMANPQNPSGALSTFDKIAQLIDSASSRSMYVLLDEAFIDYMPEHSMVRHVARYPRLIIFRSVTKFYAIPGLRIAYCVAQAPIITLLDEALPPWPVGNLASIAVQAALVDEDFAQRTRQLNAARRVILLDGLSALHLQPYPGLANFVLFRLPPTLNPATFWRTMIIKHHVVLRSCANFSHLPPGYLRAAVRREDDNERLLKALSAELP